MAKKLITIWCRRCLHRWVPRKTIDPIRCAKCRSPYWRKAAKAVR